MNLENMDPVKLANEAATAIQGQTPTARTELLAAIKRSEIDVIDDGDGYYRLSVEGNAFARVHGSRLVRAPRAPEAN